MRVWVSFNVFSKISTPLQHAIGTPIRITISWQNKFNIKIGNSKVGGYESDRRDVHLKKKGHRSRKTGNLNRTLKGLLQNIRSKKKGNDFGNVQLIVFFRKLPYLKLKKFNKRRGNYQSNYNSLNVKKNYHGITECQFFQHA